VATSPGFARFPPIVGSIAMQDLLRCAKHCSSPPTNRTVQPAVVWCRWVCHPLGKPHRQLAPLLRRGFFVRASSPALCATNGAAGRWGGGLAADDLAARRQPSSDSLDQLSPRSLAGLLFGHLPTSVGCPCADSEGGATCVIWRASPGPNPGGRETRWVNRVGG